MFDILLVFVLGCFLGFFCRSVFVLCVYVFEFFFFVGASLSPIGFGGSLSPIFLWVFLWFWWVCALGFFGLSFCLFEFFVFKILPSSSRKLYLPGSNIFHLTLKKIVN